MSLNGQHLYRFADFILDTQERILLKDDKPVLITPKSLEMLCVLIKSHGRIVEKEVLLADVWHGTFVDESNLTFTIRQLRKVLGDDAHKPSYIETIPRRGYRFIGKISENLNAALPTAEDLQNNPVILPQKPYFLIAIGIISLISMFGISFVWLNKGKLYLHKQARFTQLTNNGKITNAVVLPNGKSIVFVQKDDAGESLWLRHLDSGNQTQILPPQAVEFTGLAVSPDNKYAYYSTFSENSALQSLGRVSFSGGSPEMLPDIDTDGSVSFSPDGKNIAYTESFSSLKEMRLTIADADGSNQKVLLRTNSEKRMLLNFQASPVAWSPDGETIACAVRETDENGLFYRILLVNPNDASEKYLSEKHWNDVENIVWKDNEHLALIDFVPDSPFSVVWEISRQSGETQQLTNDSDHYQWLSSANGNIYAVKKNFFSNLRITDFAKNNTPQTKQIFGEESLIDNVEWSKDEKLYYNSWASGKNEIWQINFDGTAPRQLTTNSNLVFSFAVSPTDNTLVYSALQNGRISLFSADADGQNSHRLTTGDYDFLPYFSPDGKNVIFQKSTGFPTLWRIELDGKQSPSQLTGYLAQHPAASPDGNKIAYHFIDYSSKNSPWKLGLIDTKSHKLLNKIDFPFPITERKTVWQPNSDFLTMTFNKGENNGILLISATDGKFQTIDNIAVGKISSFAWSSNGNRLAFVENHEKSDVVLIDE